MLVLDASVILEVLLKTPVGERHADRIFRTQDSLHVPHLVDVEIAQVLRRLALSGELMADRAGQVLEELADLPLNRHEHTALLPRIWEMRESVSAFDAAYVALAEGLPGPLLTCDGKLSRAHGHHARIEYLR